MKVDAKLFQQLCTVARLKVTLEESIEPEKYLEAVTEAFSKIQEVDTENIPPSFHPLKINPSLREDIPSTPISQETILSQTTQKQDGFFKGPKAL